MTFYAQKLCVKEEFEPNVTLHEENCYRLATIRDFRQTACLQSETFLSERPGMKDTFDSKS